MNSAKSFALFAAISLLSAAAAQAASIDMDDPRRALGREDNIRVDAQLVSDTVSAGSAIAIIYQVQNLSQFPVAIADKITDATYDSDTRTITLGVGSEVPADGRMPHMTLIAPGEKKILRTAATPAINGATVRTAFEHSPRYVQVKITILRDLAPFIDLIRSQQPAVRPRLSDELFEKWFECANTIYLNSVPVRWSSSSRLNTHDAENRGSSRF